MKLIKLFLLSTILCFPGIVSSQETSTGKYKGTTNIGIVHSFNTTNFAGSFPKTAFQNKAESISTYNRYTLSLGFMIEYYLTEKLSTELNALLTYAGAYVTTNTTIYNELGVFEGNSTMKYALNYLKVPLMINYYPVDNFYLSGGGYASILTSSRKYSSWFDDMENIDNISPVDAGFVVGLGVSNRIMKVGIQYSRGMTPIIDDKSEPEMYNQMFEIVFRWKIYSESRKRR